MLNGQLRCLVFSPRPNKVHIQLVKEIYELNMNQKNEKISCQVEYGDLFYEDPIPFFSQKYIDTVVLSTYNFL